MKSARSVLLTGLIVTTLLQVGQTGVWALISMASILDTGYGFSRMMNGPGGFMTFLQLFGAMVTIFHVGFLTGFLVIVHRDLQRTEMTMESARRYLIAKPPEVVQQRRHTRPPDTAAAGQVSEQN